MTYSPDPERVGAENLCHQAIFMNHAPGAVTPLNGNGPGVAIQPEWLVA